MHILKNYLKFINGQNHCMNWTIVMMDLNGLMLIIREQSIFSFIRRGRSENDLLVFVCNFTPVVYHNYLVGVPLEGAYREILNQ